MPLFWMAREIGLVVIGVLTKFTNPVLVVQ